MCAWQLRTVLDVKRALDSRVFQQYLSADGAPPSLSDAQVDDACRVRR